MLQCTFWPVFSPNLNLKQFQSSDVHEPVAVLYAIKAWLSIFVENNFSFNFLISWKYQRLLVIFVRLQEQNYLRWTKKAK